MFMLLNYGYLNKSSDCIGSIFSRSGSPVSYPPPVGQGTRAHKTAGNQAY